MVQIYDIDLDKIYENAFASAKKIVNRCLVNANYYLPAGVNSISIDMEGQKVTVDSELSKDELLATIAKTGKVCFSVECMARICIESEFYLSVFLYFSHLLLLLLFSQFVFVFVFVLVLIPLFFVQECSYIGTE